MQYTFSLPLTPLFDASNFIVSACNQQAWRWVETWPQWNRLFLYGPSDSGKTHLGHIWALRAGAMTRPAALIESIKLEDISNHHWFIEDVEQSGNERALLHFLNTVKENEKSVLITSAMAANQLPFTLPDLTSRLVALPCTHIDQPDDEALAGVIRKQFSDRQMKIDDEVIAYILPRVERSFKKINELVEVLDRTALAEHKNLTIPFVRRIIG